MLYTSRVHNDSSIVLLEQESQILYSLQYFSTAMLPCGYLLPWAPCWHLLFPPSLFLVCLLYLPQPFSVIIFCMKPDHRVRQMGGRRPSGGCPAPMTLSSSPCPVHSYPPQLSFQFQNNSPSSSLDPFSATASNGKLWRWVEKLPGPQKLGQRRWKQAGLSPS